MLRRLLGPFLSSPAASRREVALWSLFLLGAPLALAAAFQLHELENSRRRMTITINREQALALAREQAREIHLDVTGWKSYVSFDYNEDLALYTHSRFSERPPGQRKGPPPGEAGRKGGDRRWGPDARRGGPPPGGITEVRVILVDPGRDRFLKVRMNSRGRVVGWQIGGAGAAQKVTPAPPEEARRLAEAAFSKWLGEQEAERLGEPEMERDENIAGGSGYDFTWRARNPRLPDTEYAVKVQIQGQQVIGLEGSLNFSESYQESVLIPRSVIVSIIMSLRILLIAACVCYACWRYARRSLEGEAPHQRMLGLAAAFALSGLLILALDSSVAGQQMELSLNRPAIEAVLVISSIAVFVLMGLMLGISYGSGEGEIREGFPGKMTAADCLLTGRIYNRNVGRAVVLGTAITGWCFLLLAGISATLTATPPHVPETQMGYAFGRYPILLLLFNVPVSGVFVTVTGLLLPLTFLRRHIHNRTLLLGLLGVGALLGSNLFEAPTQGLGNYLAEVLPLAIALLAGFFAGDLLTSIVACSVLSLLSLTADLVGLIPYWRENQWMLLGLAAVPLLILGLGAWSERGYGEEEVRPKHAANLASRLQMQAELSAARQAQMRLMPDGPPDVPGLSIAASCTPAREVSGDFFDFLPMANGGLTVVTGEGGNDGLASALTIALTKGYLLYRTQQAGGSAQSPRAILSRLDQVLGAMLRRESGQTSLALVCIDPIRRTCAMARVGRWPQVLLLREDNTVEEVAPGEAEQPLGANDSIVIITDGISKLLERSSGESPSEVLRRAGVAAKAESAARLHDEFLAAARASTRGTEIGDDITTVVLCLSSAERSHLESAA